MNPVEASRLLELPAGAASDAVEARFLELRAKLEEKIGHAPTPGLKEKYRASLAQVTAAFEILTLAADSSTLPVLKKPSGSGPPPSAKPAPAAGPGSHQVSGSPVAKRPKKSGDKEFIVVAIIAAFVLLIGGWWVLATRAENERKARAAAEAKVEAEKEAALEKQFEDEKRRKLAATEKAEKVRLDTLFTRQRARMADLNLAYEALLRTEQATSRELSDLKSLQSERRGTSDSDAAEIKNKVKALEMYLRWLGDYLPGNPAQIAKGRAEAALSDRNELSAGLVDAYATAIADLKVQLKANQCTPSTVGAIDVQRPLADQGDPTAMNWLSYIYFDGAGVPRDEALGVEWARKAAARDELHAMARLGNAYLDGRGVAKDAAVAFEWFRKAAEHGDAGGYFGVAYCYQGGHGVNKDLAAAIPWFEKSAATGEPAAMINLAYIHFETGNPARAVEWLKQGAALDSPLALNMLGRVCLGLLHSESGLPLDEAGGIKYLRRAARLNDQEARDILQKRSLNW